MFFHIPVLKKVSRLVNFLHLSFCLHNIQHNFSVFYFHGWMENGTQEASVVTVRGAYMDRGDHNVLTVDWSYYGKNLNYHLDVIPQMKVVSLFRH